MSDSRQEFERLMKADDANSDFRRNGDGSTYRSPFTALAYEAYQWGLAAQAARGENGSEQSGWHEIQVNDTTNPRKAYYNPSLAKAPVRWKLVPIIATREMEDACRKADAWLRTDYPNIAWGVMVDAAPSHPQPEGWQLVPVELTDAMRSAADQHFVDERKEAAKDYERGDTFMGPSGASYWRVILAAAPKV